MLIVYNNNNRAGRAGIFFKMGKNEPPFSVCLGQGLACNNFPDSRQQIILGQTQWGPKDNLIRVQG